MQTLKMPEPRNTTSNTYNYLFITGVISALMIFFSNFVILFPYRNQNTYLFHALNTDSLTEDWLAKTLDLFPIATEISEIFFGFGLFGFAAAYFLCVFIFSISILMIANEDNRLSGGKGSRIVISLAIAAPWIFAPALGANLHGLAEQYMLGGVWQPSEGGAAGLVLGIGLYVAGRNLGAALAVGMGVAIHPGSALGGALVMAAICLNLFLNRRYSEGLLSGGLCLLVSLPAFIFMYTSLSGEAVNDVRLAQKILVEYRLPHHALPGEWFGVKSVLQILIVTLAVILWRNCSKVVYIISFCAISSLALTALSVFMENNSFYLLFPWRIFAVLVPISSSLILVRLFIPLLQARASGADGPPPARLRRSLLAVVVLAMSGSAIIAHTRTQILSGVHFFGGGVYHSALAQIAQVMDPQETLYLTKDEAELLVWVRDNGPRGAKYIVPLEFETFRLFTGKPIFADWKSHPYKPSELLEWFERVRSVHEIYNAPACSADFFDDTRFASYNVAVYRREKLCEKPEKTIFENDTFIILERVE